MSRRGVGALLTLAFLFGCVTVPEYRKLEREVIALKRAQTGAVPPSDAATRLADLGVEVSELSREVAELRGAVEEARALAHEAIAGVTEIRQSPSGPAGRTSSGEAPRASGAVETRPSAYAPVEPAAGVGSEVAAYEEAFRLYRSQDYDAAIDRFGTFLQTHASSEYADNALFWLGECHFKLGHHEKAVLTFDDVVKRFPRGNKVPDALYRQGIALLEMGKATGDEPRYRRAAQQIFEQLLKDHPVSERVPEAERQLEKLKR